jgi:signal recognition particle subunit SRP54
MMVEITQIKAAVKPSETLFVVDSMTGQDAVNTAKEFNDRLDFDGVVLTKLDGDTRGGAALSIKHVTGKPIKFIGTGEKLDTIEPFHPERMASRILGMGDVLSLIEKAQEAYDEKKSAELEQKIRQQKFTLDDFLDQFQQLRNMGGVEQMLSMMPGMNAGAVKDVKVDEKAMAHMEAIIRSMTMEERVNPEIINSSRKIRIAKGSGTSVEEVNKLLRQFEQMKKMMKQFSDPKKLKKLGFGRRGMKMPF